MIKKLERILWHSVNITYYHYLGSSGTQKVKYTNVILYAFNTTDVTSGAKAAYHCGVSEFPLPVFNGCVLHDL